MPKDSNSSDVEADFVWRFRLDEKAHEPVVDDPLLELIRVQWEELLKLSIPYLGNCQVKIDGFRLMRDPDKVHAIFRDDPRWKKE
ncbi:MAG: hypothetical protein AAF483_10000 [Planctomycetota bacterium]